MKRVIGIVGFLVVCPVLAIAGKHAWNSPWVDDDAASRYIELPSGVRYPEGLTANPITKDLFVGTMDFGSNPNRLLRYDRKGRLKATRDFGPTPLLGLAYNEIDNKIYIGNLGLGQIQRISAQFTAATVPETIASLPLIGPPGDRVEGNPDGSQDEVKFGAFGTAPNAIVFTAAGDALISDSFQGAIFLIEAPDSCSGSCSVDLVIQDPLLATAGAPGFGANGLALSADETTLFIANTGDDRVLALNRATLELSVFSDAVNGADGLLLDDEGTLWASANQADQIVGLNSSGRVIAELGEFRGIAPDGSPRGLLFPASLALVRDELFVTNLAIAVTPKVGDEPEEDVTRATISRIRLHRH
jgi:hypothetical protein